MKLSVGKHKQKWFEEALRICKEDPNWPRESMRQIIAQIKKEIESCD